MYVLLRPDGARVGLPLVAAEEIAFHYCEPDAEDRDEVAPSLAVGAGDGGGGREAEGQGVEEVGEGDGGKGVVEVGGWFVRVAEGAVGQDVGAVGEVEEPGIQGCDLGPQDAVGVGEAGGSASEVEAGEEDIVGGLQAGGCCGEDVFWGEVWEGGDEGEDSGDEEDGERFGDGPGDWLHGDRGGDGLDGLGTIPGYEFRDEEGANSEEEGLDAVGMSVSV